MARSLKTVASILLLLSLALAAEKPRAPLPEKLLTAKTVFIDNQSGHQDAADNCYRALSEWGRYSVVSQSSAADLIFRLDSGSSHYTDPVPIISGQVILDNSSDAHFTILRVQDPASRDVLWTGSRDWSKKHPASYQLVLDLRDRIEPSVRTARR